ncbi:MAG TPA: GAF and ANTAR domain-containing protein [Mycobacteriales bacterium]|nr:GAF and ANTAR domain-containing protein [Mycobacteriales bacterium]
MPRETGGVPPSPTDLVHAFSALQLLMVAAPGVEGFLYDVAKLAARIVDPPGSCGITLRRGDGPLTIASSDERAELVDQAQYSSGSGPCLDSLASGAFIDVPDLGSDGRWPEFRRRAQAEGVHSCLAAPLTDGQSILGALNLYGHRPRVFDDAAQQQARTFAAQASTALVLVLRTAAQAEQSEQLERALTSRTEIDQAIGILMGQQRCTADEAFALLRQHSQNNNRKLREVAVELITRVTGEAPVSGSRFDH